MKVFLTKKAEEKFKAEVLRERDVAKLQGSLNSVNNDYLGNRVSDIELKLNKLAQHLGVRFDYQKYVVTNDRSIIADTGTTDSCCESSN